MTTRGGKKRQGKREPNGRLSRQPKHAAERNMADLDAEQRDTLSVGLDARERVFGVKPSQSRDQMAGSVIGRWCLQNIISRSQYDAAMLFQESHTRNLLAIDAPPQPAAAKEILMRGVALHPREAIFHFNLACYDAQLGRLDDARVLLDTACALDESFVEMGRTDEDLAPLRSGKVE